MNEEINSGDQNDKQIENNSEKLQSDESKFTINVPNDDLNKSNLGDDSLSKRKRKKLLRQQKWLEGKPERRRREKEKRKAKKLKKMLESKEGTETFEPIKWIKMSESKCRVSIIIDCDYDKYMNEFEMKKLCKQLNRCYSINRHSQAPVQLYITSIKDQIGKSLQKYQSGYKNWDCHVTEKHWMELFPIDQFDNDRRKKVIYLTGDSPESIPDCEQIQNDNNHIFIIGGFVDHNKYKELSLKRAKEEYKISHGKLPLAEHVLMSQRSILSIPHVFEIMLLSSNGTMGKEWKKIFEKVIPSRKLK